MCYACYSQDIGPDVCESLKDYSITANLPTFSHPSSISLFFSIFFYFDFLRSEFTWTPSGMASLTLWTWSPSASSLLTPSSTPGFLSSSPPACCTFCGPQSAGTLWHSHEILSANRLWPSRILQPTSNCLSQRWTTRSLSPVPKHCDHLRHLMWHLYLFDWRVRYSYTTYVLFYV